MGVCVGVCVCVEREGDEWGLCGHIVGQVFPMTTECDPRVTTRDGGGAPPPHTHTNTVVDPFGPQPSKAGWREASIQTH